MKLLESNKIGVLHNGFIHKISKDDPRFEEAKKLFDEDDITGFINLLMQKPKDFLSGKDSRFRSEGGKVYFGNFEIKSVLEEKINSIFREGGDMEPFENFMVRVSKNPSRTAILELFDFLSYRELPITPDGCFIGYKGVGNNYWSICGNKRTVVLEGEVNSIGQIYNAPGEKIKIERSSVDDKRENECSEGLHVGSLKYAKDHGSRVVIVKVDPADAVSVPKDYSFQKLRCCAYEVISNFREEITAPVAEYNTEDGEFYPVLTEEKEKKNLIQSVLSDNCSKGFEYITPYYVSKEIENKFGIIIDEGELMDLVYELGWEVDFSCGGPAKILLNE